MTYINHYVSLTYVNVISTITGWWFQPTPLKNMSSSVSWDDDIPNIWENKKCSKPPTSILIIISVTLNPNEMNSE